VRARFLEALKRPLDDLRVGGEKLEHFHKPVVRLRALEAKADSVERALEAIGLGLAVAEVFFDPNDPEGEP
jgi:hypothetical protein